MRQVKQGGRRVRRAVAQAAVVLLGGAAGMAVYSLMLSKPLWSWPRLDAAIMLLTTFSLTALVFWLTLRLRGEAHPHRR